MFVCLCGHGKGGGKSGIFLLLLLFATQAQEEFKEKERRSLCREARKGPSKELRGAGGRGGRLRTSAMKKRPPPSIYIYLRRKKGPPYIYPHTHFFLKKGKGGGKKSKGITTMITRGEGEKKGKIDLVLFSKRLKRLG